MSRIFILGDSFADNLYNKEKKAIDDGKPSDSGVSMYINSFIKNGITLPLYFDDWLKEWGYEVYNYGVGGCSNYEIMYQFSKIDKDFQEGDRLVIAMTSFHRHNWLDDNGKNLTVHNTGEVLGPNTSKIIREFFQQYSINADYSVENGGYIKTHVVEFFSYLFFLHKKYKPIIWSGFNNISDVFQNEKYFIWDPAHPTYSKIIPEWGKLRINEETNELNTDMHYGRYGNYYLALIIKTIIENQASEYRITDYYIMTKIKEAIKNNPPNFEKIDEWDIKNESISSKKQIWANLS
jgi:hypothetical protein